MIASNEKLLRLKKIVRRTNKERTTVSTLNVTLEMLVRGFTFANININESMAKTFVIDEDSKTLIMPFMDLDGMGEAVANKTV